MDRPKLSKAIKSCQYVHNCVADKGIAIKARYLGTPRAHSGSCVIRIRPKYRHSGNTS
jgi:hypothetical protein